MVDNVINVGGVMSVYSDCITCGIRYTVPQSMWNKQRKSGGFHRCPNGHSQGWSSDESEDERTRRERDQLKQRLAQKDDEIKRQREQREAAERRESAQKGQVTRLKNRAKAGVCPCCNRTFQNLARHMGTKHPTYATNDDPGLKVVQGGKK